MYAAFGAVLSWSFTTLVAAKNVMASVPDYLVIETAFTVVQWDNDRSIDRARLCACATERNCYRIAFWASPAPQEQNFPGVLRNPYSETFLATERRWDPYLGRRLRSAHGTSYEIWALDTLLRGNALASKWNRNRAN